MSNYNQTLQSNNADLQAILNTINTLPEAGGSGSGGGDNFESAILDGTLISYTNNDATKIKNYAFRDCINLTSVNFPACTHIGSYAFTSCVNLTSISFPACTYISDQAFRDCINLTSISFPVCTYIGSYAFSNCSNLTSVNFPVCNTIGSYAFDACTNLTSVDFPVCNTIGNYAFDACTNLTSVSFPVCRYIGIDAFRYCSSLTTVSFPKCTEIDSYAFNGCTNLSTIYLMNSSVCSLNHSNTFANTIITSTTGSIFVPASLVDSYKAATNWTYFSNRIFACDSSSISLITFTIDGISYQAEEGMTWREWVNSEYNTDGFKDPSGMGPVFSSSEYFVCNPDGYEVWDVELIVPSTEYYTAW